MRYITLFVLPMLSLLRVPVGECVCVGVVVRGVFWPYSVGLLSTR
jgi:hypothetical protein